MKKFLLLILSVFLTTGLFAQFTESFESGIPVDWTVADLASSNTWVQNTAPNGGAQDGTATASILYDSSTSS